MAGEPLHRACVEPQGFNLGSWFRISKPEDKTCNAPWQELKEAKAKRGDSSPLRIPQATATAKAHVRVNPDEHRHKNLVMTSL